MNGYLREYSETPREQGGLLGVLGYEEMPLVSTDFCHDERSSIVDAESTMVVNGTQVSNVQFNVELVSGLAIGLELGSGLGECVHLRSPVLLLQLRTPQRTSNSRSRSTRGTTTNGDTAAALPSSAAWWRASKAPRLAPTRLASTAVRLAGRPI